MILLVWGTVATAFGWIVATDARGAAHRFLAASRAARPFGGADSPFLSIGFLRVFAGLFALAGPVVLVRGLLDLWHGEPGPGALPRVPVWFAVAEAVIVGLVLWTSWRRSGTLRRAWAAGGGPRRTAAVGVTAAIVVFAVLLAAGQGTAAALTWLAGGACALTLLLTGQRSRSAGG
ncbi:hypothetical protein [Streptomyces sp. CRN 30]|uniref:hypothetical protein n=1 Tax=Streptomyces sp. CRN 30 TaxID=3075613 RepID=UPI002A7EDF11|nr:hypothetical protein [Streptomyces sp. CRN 30]